MSNNNRANIYWAVTICKVHLLCFISFTFQYNFVTGHYCPYFAVEEPEAHWDQGDAFKKEQTQQVWLHALNCSLYCLGIQSKLPLPMLLEPVPVLLEDMGIFRSCCVGFLWSDLWIFLASSPYLEGASNEPVSIVYVYAGVGATKWEWPSNWQWSHSVSVVITVRSQPAGSAGDPGRQERHS